MPDRPNPKEQPDHDPIELFADYVARRDDGEDVSFEDLLQAHPESAEELRTMHEDWVEAVGLVGDFGSGVLRGAEESSIGSAIVPGDEELERLISRLSHGDSSRFRYSVMGEVARGSMGSVLRVWDDDLHRQLAMKVILDEQAFRPGSSDPPSRDLHSVARFLEEAQVTGQLDHPGIVPVHELGVDEQGRVYFTMKLVRGRTLYEIFRKVRDGEERWTITRVLNLILKVCESMAYAHSKGVIHRDLKPSNIMVGRFGEVYVMDWGLARILGRQDTKDIRLLQMTQMKEASTIELRTDRQKHAEERPDSPLITLDGDVVGTPAYMPPEQALGLIDELEPRSDVYAVGAMLYHLLTGREPYTEPDRRLSPYVILARLLDGPPMPVLELAPDTPAELIAVCERAMARDPDDRYGDMAELHEDLRAYLEDRVVRAHQTGARAELRKWVARNPIVSRLAGAAMTLLLVAVGLGAWAISSWDDVKAAESARRLESIEAILERGFLHLGDREAGHALPLFESLLDEPGAPPEAVAGMVLASLKLGQPEEALAVLAQYADVIADHPGLRRLEIQALRRDVHRRGHVEAIQHYEALRKEHPRDFRAVAGLVLAHLEADTPSEARGVLDTDMTILDELPALRFLRLEALERDRSSAGRSMAEWQRRRLPQQGGALDHYLTGAALMVGEETVADAAEHFTTAILQTQDRPRALYYYEAIRATAEVQGTAFSRTMGKSRESINDVHRLAKAILAIWPDSAGAAENIASAYARCRSLDPGVLPEEGFDRVVDALARRAEARPDDATAVSNHARILWLSGAFEEAVRVQNRAIELEPTAGRYLEMAVIHSEEGYDEKALEYLHESLRLDPDRVSALTHLGNILDDDGDHEGALAAFRRSRKVGGPGATEAFNCGIALMHLGRFEEAERELRRSMRLNEREGEEAFPYPYARHLERLRELRRIEGCESDLAAGRIQLSTGTDYRLYTDYCRYRDHDLLGAQLWLQLFEGPRGVQPQYGYLAAISAAGAVADESLTTEERSSWHQHGIEWLQLYLDQVFLSYSYQDPFITPRFVRDLVHGYRLRPKFAALREPPEDASVEYRQRSARFLEHLDRRMEELGLGSVRNAEH